MRKLSFLILSLVLGSMLIGCGSKDDAEPANTAPAKLTPDATKPPSSENPGGASAAAPL